MEGVLDALKKSITLLDSKKKLFTMCKVIFWLTMTKKLECTFIVDFRNKMYNNVRWQTLEGKSSVKWSTAAIL